MTEEFLFKKSFAALRRYAGLQTTANLEAKFFAVIRNGREIHNVVWQHRDGYHYIVTVSGNSILGAVKCENGTTTDLMKTKP